MTISFKKKALRQKSFKKKSPKKLLKWFFLKSFNRTKLFMRTSRVENIISTFIKSQLLRIFPTRFSTSLKIVQKPIISHFALSTNSLFISIVCWLFQFVAPEVVNFEAITFATDMWSVGVIAYVLWVLTNVDGWMTLVQSFVVEQTQKIDFKQYKKVFRQTCVNI